MFDTAKDAQMTPPKNRSVHSTAGRKSSRRKTRSHWRQKDDVLKFCRRKAPFFLKSVALRLCSLRQHRFRKLVA